MTAVKLEEEAMLVRQIMQKDFFTVQSTEPIQEAARKMQEKHLATVIVLEKKRIKGIVTEEEIAKAMAATSQSKRSATTQEANDRTPDADDDRNRCCYFSETVSELHGG